MKLEYGLIWPATKVLGPGNRFVIWTQGCPRRCFKCASPELQVAGLGKTEDVTVLADMIIGKKDIDGITISGGEPMVQAEAISQLLSIVRQERPELNVILFTGYRLEELHTENRKALLQYLDVLIDGEYIDGLNDNIGLRGSSNQQVHYLTDRLATFREQLEGGRRRREIHVLGENELLTIGISDKYTNNGCYGEEQ